MSEPVWLLPEVVTAVQRMLLAEHGGLPGIRDAGLLDSALARPRQRWADEPDVSAFELAASYTYGLARNHPFADGNKRVALTVAAVFLELNGYVLDADEAETVVVIEALAAGDLDEVALADWLRENSRA
ncbi:MAG: type II toxin-antitoxin system death-on-curing family toxin [Gammaproteobacteria bacterium]